MNNIRKNVMSMIFHIITFVITLLLIIGIDIYNFKFDWSLITLEYMSTRILLSIGYMLIKTSVSNFTYDVLEVSDLTYIEIITSIDKASKKHRGARFNDTIDRLDFSFKREAWDRHIETLIFKHEIRIPKSVLLDMRENEENNFKKKTKKYISKLSRLEEMSTEEWIYKNLNIYKVKYPKITALEILYGEMEFTSEKTYLDRKPLSRVLTRSMPKSIISLAATTILGVLTIVQSDSGIGLAVAIGSILLILMTNVLMGISIGYRGHKSRKTNANKRSEILINYSEGVYDALPEVPQRYRPKMSIKTHIDRKEITEHPEELM